MLGRSESCHENRTDEKQHTRRRLFTERVDYLRCAPAVPPRSLCPVWPISKRRSSTSVLAERRLTSAAARWMHSLPREVSCLAITFSSHAISRLRGHGISSMFLVSVWSIDDFHLVLPMIRTHPLSTTPQLMRSSDQNRRDDTTGKDHHAPIAGRIFKALLSIGACETANFTGCGARSAHGLTYIMHFT